MISAIAAMGMGRELGAGNQLLWNLPNDMAHFKKQTNGKTIIMGRKTFESLPKVLPNRKHIVLSKSELDIDHEDVTVCNDFQKLIDDLMETREEVMVIGGESIYKLFFPYLDKVYLTLLYEYFPEADVFFPNMKSGFRIKSSQHYKKDAINQYDHTIMEYERIRIVK